jgi:hypothetical protein
MYDSLAKILARGGKRQQFSYADADAFFGSLES